MLWLRLSLSFLISCSKDRTIYLLLGHCDFFILDFSLMHSDVPAELYIPGVEIGTMSEAFVYLPQRVWKQWLWSQTDLVQISASLVTSSVALDSDFGFISCQLGILNPAHRLRLRFTYNPVCVKIIAQCLAQRYYYHSIRGTINILSTELKTPPTVCLS